ncbi:MAG: winged helix-turn-helix transcriptional regulator [Candidatus Poseidoniaceae archaeon]
MSHEGQGSPVCLKENSKRIIRLLGKSHVLEVIWCLVNAQEPVRFNDLRREVDVTATTLSRRLEELVDLGLVSRTVYPEVPARVEYALTERGEGLTEVMRSLWDWIATQGA